MPGSLTRATAPRPRPVEIAGRALLCAALVLVVVQVLGRPLAQSLIPVFRAAIPLLDARFEITDVRLTHVGASQVVRFRGNLSRPLVIHGRIVSPFGWNGIPQGGLQVTYTAGGVLQYGALLLIFVLAWPAACLRELACRLAVSLPCAALLSIAIVPFTVVAEFRHGLESLIGPGPAGPSLIASRYLMGGGGWMIALVVAVSCTDCARRLASRFSTTRIRTAGPARPARRIRRRSRAGRRSGAAD